jgi:tetratricopeptide (TPR) repeat protein
MKKIIGINYSIIFTGVLIVIATFFLVYSGEVLSSDAVVNKCKVLVKNNPDSVEALCKLADAYIGKYIESGKKETKWLFLSLKSIRSAMKIDSASPLPHLALARLYSIQGKSDKAQAEIDTAIKLDPNNKQVKKILQEREEDERLRLHKEAEILLKKGDRASDSDKKISYYTRAIKLDPDYPGAYKRRGLTYYGKKDYDRAVADYKKAIKLDDKDPQTFNNLGAAYYFKKKPNEAITNYSKALELDSEYEQGYSNRARAYYNAKDYRLAIKDYSKCLSFNPDDAAVLKRRGFCYRQIKDYDNAIKDYNAVINLGGADQRTYNNRGVAFYLKGEIDRAIVDYEKALELKPGYEKAKENRDIALRKKRILAPAETPEKSKKKKLTAREYNNRGVEYHKKKDINSAINAYSRAIKLKPEYALAYYNRANSWYELKKYDRALSDYAATIRLNLDYPSSYVNRSRIWVRKKNYSRARKDLKTAIRLDPENKKYRKALKKIEKKD